MKKFTLLFLTVLCFSISPTFAGAVNLMEISELKSILNSDSVVVLDVRAGRDWSTSEFKIPGAIRASGEEFAEWSTTLPKDKKLVLYCA